MLMSPDDSNRAVEHAASNVIALKLAKTRIHTTQMAALFALVDGARGCGVEFRRWRDTNLPCTLYFTNMVIGPSAFVV